MGYIWKLEAGHYLVLKERDNEPTIKKYWGPPEDTDYESNRGQNAWRALFEKVVLEHTLADVPIGLFLSAGIDSSSIAVALKNVGYNPKALTIGYAKQEIDEGSLAGQIAEKMGFEHQILSLSISDIDDLIDRATSAFDEPQGYSALLTMFAVSELAAKELKVIFSGDGGDECFRGYTWYQQADENSLLGRFGIAQWGSKLRLSGSFERIRGLLWSRQSFFHRHAWLHFPRFFENDINFLLEPTGCRFTSELRMSPFEKHFKPNMPLGRSLQRIDLMTFCTDSILPKVDRASMSHSLEVRVPFLDRRIVEWSLSAPETTDEKNKKLTKNILRKYIEGNVPGEVLSRPKQGFSLKNLSNFNWESAIRRIEQGPWVQKGYWNKEWKRLLNRNSIYFEYRVWTLLMVSRWAEKWI